MWIHFGGRARGLHGVGGELEGLLADVQMLPARGVALVAQQLLHLAPPLHQAADHLQRRAAQCARQNLPSKVLPFIMSSLASLTCSATPGKPAACKRKPIPGFPGSSSKVEGVLPRVLPGGRTYRQGL